MKRLEVIWEKKEQEFYIKSPIVGYVRELPYSEQVVTPQARVGIIRVIGTDLALYLPSHIWGKVKQVEEELKVMPVCYEQPLFILSPIESFTPKETQDSKETLSLEGGFVIPAPTDGIFYRRPSPDSPPYIEIGEIVKKGQVLGLIEVMKCFNQITFQGPHVPEKAKIVDILAKDGAEVKSNQNLFIFEAVS